jgi:hypothetical protein
MKKVDNYLLYLSGVISENQYHEEVEAKNDSSAEEVDPKETQRVLKKLSVRIGEKANTYLPLLKYLSKNKQALQLFVGLVDQLVLVQVSRVKGLFEPKNSADMPIDLRNLVRSLGVKLGEKSNTYVPLLRYVIKNKNMKESFEHLVKELSLLSPSKGKNIIK